LTVNEMIERLQEVAENGSGDCELRLAFQPSWPLQFTVGGVAEPGDPEDPEDPSSDDEPVDAASVVYITEGGHPSIDSPYAPAWAFDTAR
jgi:hypothetical protein